MSQNSVVAHNIPGSVVTVTTDPVTMSPRSSRLLHSIACISLKHSFVPAINVSQHLSKLEFVRDISDWRETSEVPERLHVPVAHLTEQTGSNSSGSNQNNDLMLILRIFHNQACKA